MVVEGDPTNIDYQKIGKYRKSGSKRGVGNFVGEENSLGNFPSKITQRGAPPPELYTVSTLDTSLVGGGGLLGLYWFQVLYLLLHYVNIIVLKRQTIL